MAADKALMLTRTLQQMTNKSAQYRGISKQGQKK
jgi:hypothetical protein